MVYSQKMMFSLTIAILFYLWPLLSVAGGGSARSDQLNMPYYMQQTITSPQAIRDPFTPSQLMFDVANKMTALNGAGFTRSPNNLPIPKMRLRGFVNQNSNEPIALLEVAGARTYLVREGDDINIDPARPNSVIRITEINRQSITVETGLLGAIRVQR